MQVLSAAATRPSAGAEGKLYTDIETRARPPASPYRPPATTKAAGGSAPGWRLSATCSVWRRPIDKRTRAAGPPTTHRRAGWRIASGCSRSRSTAAHGRNAPQHDCSRCLRRRHAAGRAPPAQSAPKDPSRPIRPGDRACRASTIRIDGRSWRIICRRMPDHVRDWRGGLFI